VLTTKHICDLISDEREEEEKATDELPLVSQSNRPGLDVMLSPEVLSKVQPGHGLLIDIHSATHMQTRYLRDNLYMPRRSWFSSWVEYSSIEDESRLIQSVQELYEVCDIYRTAFIESERRFYQAIFDSWKIDIEVVHDPESVEIGSEKILASGAALPAILGAPLARFILVRGPDERARLVFSMSHAIYDAISLHETLQTFSTHLQRPKSTTPGVEVVCGSYRVA
jgi:hypothetical protein